MIFSSQSCSEPISVKSSNSLLNEMSKQLLRQKRKRCFLLNHLDNIFKMTGKASGCTKDNPFQRHLLDEIEKYFS